MSASNGEARASTERQREGQRAGVRVSSQKEMYQRYINAREAVCFLRVQVAAQVPLRHEVAGGQRSEIRSESTTVVSFPTHENVACLLASAYAASQPLHLISDLRPLTSVDCQAPMLPLRPPKESILLCSLQSTAPALRAPQALNRRCTILHLRRYADPSEAGLSYLRPTRTLNSNTRKRPHSL